MVGNLFDTISTSPEDFLFKDSMKSLSSDEYIQFMNWLAEKDYYDELSSNQYVRDKQLALIYNQKFVPEKQSEVLFNYIDNIREPVEEGLLPGTQEVLPYSMKLGENFANELMYGGLRIGEDGKTYIETPSLIQLEATPTAASDSGGGKPDDTTGGGGEPSPVFITPDAVDENVYKALPEDLALALSPIDRAWTPANNFLNASSIVNPGAALVYGLTTIGGDIAQALLDKANIDIPITYDRATDERTLNRYADLLGADIVKTDGNYGLKYSKEAAERAGLSQPTTGGTSRNAIRAIFDLEPFKTDFLVPDNLFDYAAESDYEESKYINRSENPQTFESNKSSSYYGLNTGTSGTGTTSGDSILNQSKTGTSVYTVGTN